MARVMTTDEIIINDCNVTVRFTTRKEIFDNVTDCGWYTVHNANMSDWALYIVYTDGTRYINVEGDESGEYKGKTGIESIILSTDYGYLVSGKIVMVDFNNPENKYYPENDKFKNFAWNEENDWRAEAIRDYE